MGHVYRVGSMYGTEYFNTAKETDRHKPGGEKPESVRRVDAARECNRLNRLLDETERELNRLRHMLRELLEECHPNGVAETEIGRRVQQYFNANPVSPATSADRDGQRSYGI